MNTLVVTTVNPRILRTFVQSIFLFQPSVRKDYELLVYPDLRNTSLEEIQDAVKLSPISTKIHSLDSVEAIKGLVGNESNEKVEAYIRYQTHNFKIAAMFDLWKKGIKEFFFLDDDTVVLRDLKSLFEFDIYSLLIRNALYYVHKNSQENMKEHQAFLDIVGVEDDKEYFEHTEKFVKTSQYNAGHFKMTLTEDFIESIKRFYLNPYLKDRFLETVWDLDSNTYKAETSFFHKSFFDEQKFLTYYFYCNPERVETEFLNRNSSVYLSKKEDEFLNLSFSELEKKVSKNKIIHYVGKEKERRAEYFFTLKKNVIF